MTAPARYSTDFRTVDLIARGVTTIVRCPVYRAGELAIPTSGTVTIYDETYAAIVTAASVTITDGVATYSVAGATTTGRVLSDGWRIAWSLALPDAATYVAENSAALCRHVPQMPVSEAAIFARVPSLAPDSPGRISTRRDYSTTLEDAWTQIREMLLAKGRRHELVVTATRLREPMLLLVLSLIFEDLATGMQDGSAMRATATEYRRQFSLAWGALSFEYDVDDDGEADTRQGTGGTMWLY